MLPATSSSLHKAKANASTTTTTPTGDMRDRELEGSDGSDSQCSLNEDVDVCTSVCISEGRSTLQILQPQVQVSRNSMLTLCVKTGTEPSSQSTFLPSWTGALCQFPRRQLIQDQSSRTPTPKVCMPQAEDRSGGAPSNSSPVVRM
ncbi:hypothetical protein INR49_016286 [Caranx melampygus]|nr:hypothetical protein INR49_016286 [Caranx melampygus]